MIVKLLKTKDKEKVMKLARKRHTQYTERNGNTSKANFSSKTKKKDDTRTNFLKCLKTKKPPKTKNKQQNFMANKNNLQNLEQNKHLFR